MKASAEYFDKRGHLLIKVLVSWTVANATRVIDEALGEATKRGHLQLLFDLRNWTAPDMESTRYFSGLHLAKVLPPSFKAAAFGFPEAINKFGEDAATNRGAQFRVFPDEQSALQWLMEGTAGDAQHMVPADGSDSQAHG
jgi:hypothetical protein